MADVFVSYSRQDKARAAQFVQLLEGYGWDVFWDQETRAGTIWPKVLEDELNQARCLLVLWTASSVASRWVRIEAYEALQNDKLLPVRLEKVKPPMEFRQTQTFDLIGWTGELEDPRLQHLIADLCAFAKIEPRIGAVAPSSRTAVPTLVPAPASEEWLAAPTVSGAPDFTTHRAPTYRSIPGVAVPTFAPRAAEPDRPDSSSARSDERRSTTVALDTDAAPNPATSPTTSAAAVDRVGPDGAVRSSGSPADSSRSRLWWGLGLAVAALAAVWIARTVVVPGGGQSSEGSRPGMVTDTPDPNAVAAPADPTPPSSPVIETSPTDKPKARAADAPRTTPSRCIEIAEKFQTTGQLTAEERQFLSSKECAK